MLKINKKEYVSKTFRLDKSLTDKLENYAYLKNISLNKLVEICCNYALENLSPEEQEELNLYQNQKGKSN